MGIGFLIAVALMAGLLIGVHFLEKRSNATRELTEAELLFILARLTETSEFEQFRRAAESWNISRDQIETDFTRYLFRAHLPHYVRDYLRKARDTNPDLQGCRPDFLTGAMIKPKRDV